MLAEVETESLLIRRLWPGDQAQITNHFKSLDADSRRMRFGGTVSEKFAVGYAENLLELGSIAYGAHVDRDLRAVGELRGILDDWPATAEAAFSVQKPWQDKGLGEALMNRVIIAAQNRGVKSLHMMCLAENKKMQHLARKHDALLELHPLEVRATLDQPWPTPMSLAEEFSGEARGFVQAVMRWPH